MMNREQTAVNILLIAPQIMRIVTAELRQTPYPVVPAHLAIFFVLEQHSANLSELAEKSAVSLPTMSNTISYMVREGWVVRTRSEQDRRMVLIEITPAGKKMLAEIQAHLLEQIVSLMEPLNATEEAALDAGLAILQTIFERLPEES